MPLFIVAVLVGWFMPAHDPVVAPSAQRSVVQPPVPAPRKANLPGEASGIVLEKQQDGHFYADANVNGQNVRFLVDTGASVVALTDADAQRLGLFWNYNELQYVGRGVSGNVTGKPVTIAELRLGGLTAFNVRAVIIPDGLDVSLLGQSFLSQVPHVGIAGDRMTLGG